jgi:hypothetical protein
MPAIFCSRFLLSSRSAVSKISAKESIRWESCRSRTWTSAIEVDDQLAQRLCRYPVQHAPVFSPTCSHRRCPRDCSPVHARLCHCQACQAPIACDAVVVRGIPPGLRIHVHLEASSKVFERHVRKWAGLMRIPCSQLCQRSATSRCKDEDSTHPKARGRTSTRDVLCCGYQAYGNGSRDQE